MSEQVSPLSLENDISKAKYMVRCNWWFSSNPSSNSRDRVTTYCTFLSVKGLVRANVLEASCPPKLWTFLRNFSRWRKLDDVLPTPKNATGRIKTPTKWHSSFCTFSCWKSESIQMDIIWAGTHQSLLRVSGDVPLPLPKNKWQVGPSGRKPTLHQLCYFCSKMYRFTKTNNDLLSTE